MRDATTDVAESPMDSLMDRGQLEFFAPCARGTEPFLAEELRALGVRRVRPLASGVAFYGSLKDAYRALLWSRVASRVLLVLERVSATDADALYEGVRGIDWAEQVPVGATIAVNAHGVNDALRNTQFSAVKTKDAICDQLRARRGERPSVDTAKPDVLVNVSLRGQKATVAIDLAGIPLFKRGYRAGSDQGQAPLKETLAAAVLLAAGWPALAAAEGVLVDPLCGSGTLAIEGACMAADVAPGIFRDRWGFQGWGGHDTALWDELVDEADERADVGLAVLASALRVFAADIDPKVVAVAEANARRAGLGSAVAFCVSDVAALRIPANVGQGATCGWLLATNPPYGERLSSLPELPALYEALGNFVLRTPRIAHEVVITSDPRVDRAFGHAPSSVVKTNNGPLDVTIRCW